MVESQPSKLLVASSILVSRSIPGKSVQWAVAKMISQKHAFHALL